MAYNLGLDNYEVEYDSANDELIFRHRGTGNTVTYTSDGGLQVTAAPSASADVVRKAEFAPESIVIDTAANRPAAGTADRVFVETDTGTIYRDDGAAWNVIGTDTVAAVRNLQPEGSQTGLTADATGVQYEGEVRQLLDSALLESNRSVYLEAATNSSAGDETVTVEVYDDDATAVVESMTISGGSPRARSAELSDSLTAGNEVHVRWNVTTASGTSGATFDALAARLVIE